jgi:poly(3-hydroxybutyrate) depolymerase
MSIACNWLRLGAFATLLSGCASDPGGSPSGAAGNAAAGTSAQTTAGAGGANGVSGAAGSAPANTGGAGASSGGSAGASGSAPSGGTGGAAGAGPGGGSDAARPSAGCNKPADIAPGEFVMQTVMGTSTWVRLPVGYDPMRAYPIVFVWKGCGATGRASFGMENIAGNDAIIAQGDFPPGQSCYDTADGALFVDLPVFDALLAQIETNYCVDEAHVFSVGFSSGAWLTQLLACQRGDVLRGIGTIAGGFKPTFFNGATTCKGSGLSAFMVSDLDDHENPFYDEDVDGDSVEIAVNQWLGVNGCSEKTWTLEAGMPTDPDQAVCRAYADCGRFPVKLCLTSGKGHSAQESLSFPGFWQLFQQSLPN